MEVEPKSIPNPSIHLPRDTDSPIRMFSGLKVRRVDSSSPSLQEARLKIQALYDSDHPFFTRQVLRDAARQLENFSNSYQDTNITQAITLKGLDGVMVEFPIETGEIYPSREPGYEFITQQPCIRYRSFQDLIRTRKGPTLAYCNVRISHRQALRDILTKELYHKDSVKSTAVTLEFLHNHLEAWETTHQCEQFKSTMLSLPIVRAQKISKIVGFAFGSLARDHGSEWLVPAFQHALLLILRNLLLRPEYQEQKIPCYVQDPIYNPTDKLALETVGIHVLDDPEGFLGVDDSTIVISCAPNAPIKEIISDIARPAIWITNPIKPKDPDYIPADPDSPRVRRLIQEFYEEVEFPGEKKDFGPLTIYARRV